MTKVMGWFWAAAGACLAPCGVALADTAHLTADADTNNGAPATNNGLAVNMFIRNTTSVTRNVFVRFDLSTIPPGTVLEQASLRMWIGPIATPGGITFHVVTEDWAEGTITHTLQPARDPM